jgi:DNA-binding SARP family transcriptional activator
MLQFSILGPIEIRGDSGEIRITAQRERALLALLLLQANRVIATDALIDRLWGEQPPRTASNSLQNAVSHLRRLLGAGVVETRAPGYLVRVEPDLLDLARFERLRDRARGEQPAERAQTLREALALWRGEPLADLAYEPCVEDDIRHLAALRLDALEERIGADLALGRYVQVIAELESLVQANGDREKLVGHLMLALHQAGRDIEANAAFHACSRRLDEVGLLPQRELQELHRSILRHDPALRPAAAERRGRPGEADLYSPVVRALLAGRLVPVLGLLAPPSVSGPPTAAAAAEHLAVVFGYPAGRDLSLTRVSHYVAVTHGVGPLYDELRDLYGGDYEPGPVHAALASLSRELRVRGLPAQIVVTPSYDRTLERAYLEAKEKIDVLSYVAFGRDRGKFLHLAPDGECHVIDEPNVEVALASPERAVVLKINGGVRDPAGIERDSYVVSEDDYIDYLAETPLASLLPVGVAARLSRSHFLFLGYDLEEWTPRVFLRRLWGDSRIGYRSWAVGPIDDPLIAAYWRQSGVEPIDVPLEDFIHDLLRQLDTEPAGEAAS